MIELSGYSRAVLAQQFTTPTPPLTFAPPPSLNYLIGYLEALGVAAVLREDHYVDRHFLDDFARYYSRSFSAPSPKCERFHFWSIPPEKVNEHLENAYISEEKRRECEVALEACYLGFVVKRPLAAAPIGRTVLRTYPADGRRHYDVVRSYRVNIGAVTLSVKGLAYQQQDRGAAVCASTSLWSALQKVAVVAGHRTPTPIAITEASQSPFPASHGLELSHMALALSSLGYIADVFAPEENRDLFRATLVSALQSQLPVVLGITKNLNTVLGEKQAGHAITITGFSEAPAIRDVHTPHPRNSHGRSQIPPVRMKSGSLDVIYVHDDNLGSHAHYELFDSDETNEVGHKRLKLRRGRQGETPVAGWTVDEWAVEWALVPKPDKLRMPVQNLFLNVLTYRRLTESIFSGIDLHFDARFASGVHYRRDLIKSGVDLTTLRDFDQQVNLPRHLGIVSVYSPDSHLLDAVLDVSEIERVPSFSRPLCFVCPGVPKHSIAWLNIQRLASVFTAPFITGPFPT